jgi:hypothetical protein
MQRARLPAMGGNPTGLVAWAGLAIAYGFGVRALRRLGKPTPEEPASGRVVPFAPALDARDRRAARTVRSAGGGGRA